MKSEIWPDQRGGFGCKWPYNREDYCSTVFHFVTALDQSKIVYNVKVWFPFKIQNINVHQIMVEWIIAYELLQPIAGKAIPTSNLL
jgi:hypothetical protein